jgi:hypothetical protein
MVSSDAVEHGPVRASVDYTSRDRCRFGASLQVSLNLFPEFAKTAAKKSSQLHQGDAPYVTTGEQTMWR